MSVEFMLAPFYEVTVKLCYNTCFQFTSPNSIRSTNTCFNKDPYATVLFPFNIK